MGCPVDLWIERFVKTRAAAATTMLWDFVLLSRRPDDVHSGVGGRPWSLVPPRLWGPVQEFAGARRLGRRRRRVFSVGRFDSSTSYVADV